MMSALDPSLVAARLSRDEILDALKDGRGIRCAAEDLGVSDVELKRRIVSTRLRCRNGRTAEAMELRNAGLRVDVAAWASGCSREEIEARHGRTAPRVNTDDLLADALHIARWGHV